MKYHFKVHKDKTSYWAECMELSGCFTQAKTLKTLNKNMQESLNLYLEEPDNSSDLAPLPDNRIKKSKNVVLVAVSPKIALSLLIRRQRIKSKMTPGQAARAIGFQNVASYKKLESGKSNPSLNVIVRIKQIFPEISIDYAFS